MAFKKRHTKLAPRLGNEDSINRHCAVKGVLVDDTSRAGGIALSQSYIAGTFALCGPSEKRIDA